MAILCEAVEYHGDRLFDGAVDLDWYLNSTDKSNKVAQSYIFHGPQYHTGNVADIRSNNNSLTDSITMVSKLLESVAGLKNQMILDIAGYGAGKSHFALMVSVLLSTKNMKQKHDFLERISQIDSSFRKIIEIELEKDERPVLVIPINGMRNCNLKEEFFRTVRKILIKDQQPLDSLKEFDPRFINLQNIVKNHRNQDLMIKSLLKAGLKDIDEFYDAMSMFNVEVYDNVVRELNKEGEPVYAPAAHGELKDLIPAIAHANCGKGNYYRSMLIVFDEFGKYMMFAASNESIAGSGIMQQLFEGIQSTTVIDNQDQKWLASLLGLSQLDLKEYQFSTDSDINSINNKSRYVTRFDGAARFYLSVSFESLIANLLEKKIPSIIPNINNPDVYKKKILIQELILNRFPSSKQFPVWSNKKKFIESICLGCWPLSPHSVWMLTYITSVNNILQQRSSLNLLGSLFSYKNKLEISIDSNFLIYSTDFYDAGLGLELLSAEQLSNDPYNSATKCRNIIEKYGKQLNQEEHTVLKAIVLSQKMQAYCRIKDSSIDLLSELSGISRIAVVKALSRLEDEFNSVEFDERANLFLLVSDAPSAREFQKKLDSIAFNIKKDDTIYSKYARVDNYLLSTEFENLRNNLFPNVECDFSMNHDIFSIEWLYKAEVTSLINYDEYFKSSFSLNRLGRITHFAVPKGRILYLIIPGSTNIEEVSLHIKDLLFNLNESVKYTVPIMCFLVSDVSSIIADSVLQLDSIKHFNHEELEIFSSLIKKQKKGLIQNISNEIEKRKSERCIVSAIMSEGLKLKELGELLFESAYPNVIPFKIDGFGKSSGNGTTSAKKFITILGDSDPSWLRFTDRCTTVDVSRAKQLFLTCWKAVNSDEGSFIKIPDRSEVAILFQHFDRIFKEQELLQLWEMYEIAQSSPYGANSTQASLLVMLYYASRNILFEVRLEDESVKMQSLFARNEKELFDTRTKGLNEKIFQSIILYPVINDDSRWITLLEEWSNAKAISTLIECKEKSEELIKNRIKKPDSREKVFTFYLEKSIKAETKKMEWDKTGKQIYINLLNLLETRNSYASIVYEFQKFFEVYNKTFKSSPDDLLISQKNRFETTIEEVRNYIIVELDDWIERHVFPTEYKKEEFEKLEKKYINMQRVLDTLGFNDEQKHLSEILGIGQKRQQTWAEYYRQIFKTNRLIDPFDRSFKQYGALTLIQSKKIVEECEEEEKKLWAFDPDLLSIINTNFDNAINKISNIRSKYQAVINEKKIVLEEMFSREITSVEDLNILQNDIGALYNFYQEDINLETIKDMQKEVQLLRHALNCISDNNLSWVQFDKQFIEQKKLIEFELQGDSCLDDDAILDSFYKDVSDKRNILSKKWLEMRYEEEKKVEDLIAAQQLIYNIDAHPVYVNSQDWKEALELKETVYQYVSTQKVEYIYSLFKELSDSDKLFLSKKISEYDKH